MGITQLYNDNLRKLPNEYGDVSAMYVLAFLTAGTNCKICFVWIKSALQNRPRNCIFTFFCHHGDIMQYFDPVH